MKGNEHKTYKLTPRNLSDAELQKRLDLYSERGNEKQFFSIQKIKKSYLESNRTELDKRVKSDLFYAQGIRAGLPHTSHESIKYTRAETDQKLRDHIVKEAKSEYRKHQNLSKWFNKDDHMLTEKQKQVDRGEAHQKINGLMTKYNAIGNPMTMKGKSKDRDIER